MTPNPDPNRLPPVPSSGQGMGYKSFVAWRYLRETRRRLPPVVAALLFGGLGALAVLVLLRALLPVFHLEVPLPSAPIVELVVIVFIIVVEFTGVLPLSKPALIFGLIGLVLMVPSLGIYLAIVLGKGSWLRADPDQLAWLAFVFRGIAAFGGSCLFLAMFFGTLRCYFTFFTTVPIGGVWIGITALVSVLSVMGGFETDLRDKILGSNAHLQITREDGEFTEWRTVKARIDRMPEVVASTPYAVSEVVIAANNTGMNVIIKGIDPSSVGKVTDLVSDLEAEDRDAMNRLAPLITDSHDLRVPQHPRSPTSGPVLDPPPDDMPMPGEPIDFSHAAPASGPEGNSGNSGNGGNGGNGGSNDEGSGSGSGTGKTGDAGKRAASDDAPAPAPTAPPVPPGSGDNAPFGGDAVRVLVEGDPLPPEVGARPGSGVPRAPAPAPPADRGNGGHPVVDPPPPDLISSDEPPADYSRPDYLQDAVKVIDLPFDTPSLSRRTQSLPGILVGRELVKQTHLYTGQEVRVVSPLSDPSNPDATGTPIPFNRDYRVAGKFFTGMYEYDLKYVYVTLESLQEFLDRGDTIDGIEVRVSNPYDTDVLVAQFQSELGPHYRVQDWKELNQSLFTALKLEKIAMFLVLGIVIVVASFSILGNLIMVVVEKGREIALLKTLGATDAGVMQLFAIQGTMIGLIGTALGVVTGLLVCWGLKSFGFPLNADVYYIDKLPVHVDGWSVAAAAAAGILISILATLYPSVIAARVRPAAGMRQ